MLTSREAAERAYGREAVQHYETVKAFYTRFGNALEQTFAEAVGGRQGIKPEPDVVTDLGPWEFCTQHNSKNADGYKAAIAKVGEGRLVQVLGHPQPGYISGLEFLRRHGIENPKQVAARAVMRAYTKALNGGEQLALVSSG